MRFVNNGIYLFPDSHSYIAQKPTDSLCWTFHTLDQWLLRFGVWDLVYRRWPNGEWRKHLRKHRSKRLAVNVSSALDLDDKILFSGTVLAKKKGRMPKPDRDWFWKLDFRVRDKY
jgi:hypothetical protein